MYIHTRNLTAQSNLKTQKYLCTIWPQQEQYEYCSNKEVKKFKPWLTVPTCGSVLTSGLTSGLTPGLTSGLTASNRLCMQLSHETSSWGLHPAWSSWKWESSICRLHGHKTSFQLPSIALTSRRVIIIKHVMPFNPCRPAVLCCLSTKNGTNFHWYWSDSLLCDAFDSSRVTAAGVYGIIRPRLPDQF